MCERQNCHQQAVKFVVVSAAIHKTGNIVTNHNAALVVPDLEVSVVNKSIRNVPILDKRSVNLSLVLQK